MSIRKKNNEGKFCGECCWFCFEDAYGEGQCYGEDDGYPMMATMCNCHACERFVSRQEMRHHMAVLLQYRRWLSDYSGEIRKSPNRVEVMDAAEFAYRYMKVFSKL